MIMLGQNARVSLAAAGASLSASPRPAGRNRRRRRLRFIPQADLRSLDPIWTTAYVTRNFGYMVYDTLFALDKDFKPQPQMVDSWKVSDDKLTYTFTLRDGLKWHDGTPVRAADCIASIERWGKRDPFGQKLMEAVDAMQAVDDKTFTIKLKSPFPLMLDALGKLSSNVPFMMPERLAKTDAFQQITEAIGSGPFKFVKEEWVPGQQGGLRQEHRLRAAQGAAELCRRRQGRQGRPRRVALHPRYGDRGGGAQRRRGRLVRAAAGRPPAGACRQQGRHGHDRRPARQSSASCASTTCSRRSTTRRCARRC